MSTLRSPALAQGQQAQEGGYPEPDELARLIRYEPQQGAGAASGAPEARGPAAFGLEDLLALGVKPEDVARVREKYEAVKRALLDRQVRLEERSVFLSDGEAVVPLHVLCGLSTLVVFPFDLEGASIVVSSRAISVQRLGSVLAVTPVEEHAVGTVGVVVPEGGPVLLAVKEVSGAQRADGVVRLAYLRRLGTDEIVEFLVGAVVSGREPDDPRVRREGFRMRPGSGPDVVRTAELGGLRAFALRGRYRVDPDPNLVLMRREGGLTVLVVRGRVAARRAEDGRTVVLGD